MQVGNFFILLLDRLLQVLNFRLQFLDLRLVVLRLEKLGLKPLLLLHARQEPLLQRLDLLVVPIGKLRNNLQFKKIYTSDFVRDSLLERSIYS